MALPNLGEFFISPRSSGITTIWREFLGYFVKQFWPGVNTQIDKLPFTRLDFPLLVLPFFLLAFLALLAFWKDPRPRNAIFAGITAGLLGYVYFHTWVYWTLVVGFVAIATFGFYRRDTVRVRGVALLIAVLAIVLIPYAVNYYQFVSTPGHEDFALRLSLAEGREFFLVGLGFDYVVYLVLALLIGFLYFKKDRKSALFFFCLLGAMVAVWNVQVFTGFVPAPDHWPKAISVVLYILSAVVFFELTRFVGARSPRFAAFVPVILFLIIFGVVTKKVVNVISLSRGLQPWVAAKHSFPKDIVDSWDWINTNIPGEPRIVSSSFLTSQYLAVYTSARPYLPQSIISPLPTKELEERYLVVSRLFDVPETVMKVQLASKAPPMQCDDPACYYRDENFGKATDDLYACFFSRGGVNTYFRQGCGRVPEERRSELLLRYRALNPIWQDIEGDYVYYGIWERQFSQPDFEHDPKLTLVYENPMVKIFRIQKP